ncbi:hypothetical protein PIROE2DRAFT_7937 [Piromyces sp. E2]|nr:hypothetical protein PIROE2DRAFT_7937 [Piromyces sp. E2]|eukprot:OUM65131.1 hypothetical protein PIROE2DRAFT_7937 [Piromyces sp. E2]
MIYHLKAGKVAGCIFSINGSQCTPNEVCNNEPNGIYAVTSNGLLIGEKLSGNIIIKKDTNTCTVLSENKDNYTGFINGSEFFYKVDNKWNRRNCNEIGEGYAVINSGNKKQVITKNCNVINGSANQEKFYFLFNSNMIIKCKNNENCSVFSVWSGSYNGGTGVVKCNSNSSTSCGLIKNSSSHPKYYLNDGSDKGTKPLIKCAKGNCTNVTASVGYYLDIDYYDYDGPTLLIKCSSSTSCSPIYDYNYYRNKLYENQNEDKSYPFIKCDGECKEYIPPSQNIPKYFAISGKLAKYVNNSCKTISATGYFLNGLKTDNGQYSNDKYNQALIYCPTSKFCEVQNGKLFARLKNSDNSGIYCTLIPKRCKYN